MILWQKEISKTAVADMKHLRRITSLEELPSSKKLIEYIKLGMYFNEPTTKLPPREKRAIAEKTPADLAASLRANPKARMTFEAFAPSKRKDYIFWITAAKTPETREIRIKTAINWVAQGKPRNWKYELKIRSSKRWRPRAERFFSGIRFEWLKRV